VLASVSQYVLSAYLYFNLDPVRLEIPYDDIPNFLQDITSVGNSLFFLGSRLGDSLLVQFSCRSGPAASLPGLRDEVIV